MNKQAMETLERMVDSYSLAAVVQAIGIICYEKADHVAENWQDEQLAKDWHRDAQVVDAIVSELRNAE
jgi:hypothetical protein